MKKTTFIIIAGPSGSGKTTISEYLSSLLMNKEYNVCVLNQDNFYKNIEDIPKTIKNQLNFDHPDAFDWKRIRDVLDKIIHKKDEVTLYKYNFALNKYTNEEIKIKDVDILIFEGIYTLYDEEIFKLADLKIYIQTDLDECLIRRMQRDLYSRGRDIDSIIFQWRSIVKPMFEKFIKNSQSNADVIIPWGSTKHNVIELISKWIEYKVKN